MKKAFIPFVLISILTVTSCSLSKKNEKKLIGKYAVEMLNTNTKESNSYGNLMKDLLEGSYIQFNKDKSYELNIAGKKITGSWIFSNDGKTILTDNKNIIFKINQFTETGLELTRYNTGNALIMTLKKVSE